MKELTEAWRDYKNKCEIAWKQEQERAAAINKDNLNNGQIGFEFPKRTPENTVNFEGFMQRLENEYDTTK